MLDGIIKKVFGSKNERDVKKLDSTVDEINAYFESYQSLSDDELKAHTDQYRERLQNGETTDDIMVEAFATVKEACRRLIGTKYNVVGNDVEWDMIPFDVQLIGAVCLHQGKIAEMATGEGKTLVATMPLYLNSLTGKGAHLVTVNDYLARRDAEWMQIVFNYLGCSVGTILSNMEPAKRRESYQCDITYGTNNEFGFDYLRDNMANRIENIVQVRGHNYAIVDEVDSVLIDEARTPLIISGPVASSTHENYRDLNPLVESLVKVQTRFVNSLIAEGEELLEKEENYDAGYKLLIAQKGAPKNKRLQKLFQRAGIQKLVMDVEGMFMRDKKLTEVDEELYYSIDEKRNLIDLTDKGRNYIAPNNPQEFILPDLADEFSLIEDDEDLSPEEKTLKKNELQADYAAKNERLHNISQLLKAYTMFEKEVEYVVQEGKVLIVDEFTGRIMYGRRYSDGLHQALEAKENVRIEGHTQTLASITLQNYFRLYDKLAGMTGTAETEANEFWDIYKLDVMVIPTNRPIARLDLNDLIYRTRREKFNAITDACEHLHKNGRPVLVGTISVEVSETLARMLKRRGVPHEVLNAKYHQKEAEIVAKAGQPGSITIATNMAGRGTDIKLGPGVRGENSNGTTDNDIPYGLQIIGTERHESRRIDRQLRGRAGRQGDPGSSQFFLSLEDDLMRLFQSERVIKVMDRLGAEEGEVITHAMVTKAIEKAQKRVESQNFSIRKHLLEYDDVMNKQREVIYERRRKALVGESGRADVIEMLDEFIDAQFETFGDPKMHPEEWDLPALNGVVLRTVMVDVENLNEPLNSMDAEALRENIKNRAMEMYDYKFDKAGVPVEQRNEVEKWLTMRVIDEHWKDHLHQMDMLKEGIGLRAYGQKDPLIEYKKEAYDMFVELVDTINQKTLELLWRIEIDQAPTAQKSAQPKMVLMHRDATNMGFSSQKKSDIQKAGEAHAKGKAPVRRESVKVGRNDPCPCGSGKKYKKCHGAVQA